MEGPKCHPQIHAERLLFWNPMRQLVTRYAWAEHGLLHLFPSFNHLSPQLRPTCFLIPWLSQAPCLWGGRCEICPPVSLLGWSESESVSHSFVSNSLQSHGLPREFSRQEYWRGLPFPSPGDLPDPGIKPGSSAFQVDSLLSEQLITHRHIFKK